MGLFKHDFVNTDNIDKTIASIKKSTNFFMGDWGTCIAHHALKAAGDNTHMSRSGEYISNRAADILGIDREEAVHLFAATHLDKDRAVKVLKTLRDTGKFLTHTE